MKVTILCNEQMAEVARSVIGLDQHGSISTFASEIQIDSNYRSSDFFHIECERSELFSPKNKDDLILWITDFVAKQEHGDQKLFFYSSEKLRLPEEVNASSFPPQRFRGKNEFRDLVREFARAQRWQIIQIVRFNR